MIPLVKRTHNIVQVIGVVKKNSVECVRCHVNHEVT